MIDGLKPLVITAVLLAGNNFNVQGKDRPLFLDKAVYQDSTKQDSLTYLNLLKSINKRAGSIDTVDIAYLSTKPYISAQEAVKGFVAGVMVNDNTGEPGVQQNVLIRGLKQPLLYKSDIFNQQPLIILDGIPLIGDHPFVHEIKKYDNVAIGPGTNQFANSDMDNISSIEVIKDPVRLAYYGPLASNGVILVTTKQPLVGERRISINSFFGSTLKENVTTVNGDYENRFRSQFYHLYGNQERKLNYAGYLRDSTNTDYYGPTNWQDLYYQSQFMHNVNLSITGGSERANFRFYGGVMSKPGSADNTDFKRYNGVFYINMVPFKWMTMSSMVNVAKLDRKRNKSLRDRYNETGYLPDVTTPLPPGGNIYQNFLNEYDKVIDDNINNMVKGYVSLRFDLFRNFKYTTQFSFDYNQSIRDSFFPTTLMESINYVSNYFGYNQRYNIQNKINYKFDINESNKLDFEVGNIYWSDIHKYNYSSAFDGPSDFVKINVVQGNSSQGGYLNPVGFTTYRFTDNLKHNLSSFYGFVNYSLNDYLELNYTGRYDGSSNRRPDVRWTFSNGVGSKLNIKHWLPTAKAVDALKVGLSFSRISEAFSTDQFAYGPQFRSDLGWNEEPAVISYNGFATVSRPYSNGWIGYDIATPYSDKYNFNILSSFFANRLELDLSLYSNTTKDLSLLTSVPQEYGYSGKISSGMDVNNKGIEAQLSITPVRNRNLNWRTSFVMSYNVNTLKRLPNGLQSIVIGDRKLEVGESISKYWLLENEGIISNSAQIPTHSNGDPINFNGIPLQVGDPIWTDNNNDGIINNEDKVLKGNMIAPFVGAWNNTLTYKNWTLDIASYAHIGNKILNNSTANYYDFINNEQSNSLNSIKEIFHWQQLHDIDQHPYYNPWSPVIPYRKDQDLFLEDGSFFKLRALTLGYDFRNSSIVKSGVIKRLYVYGTAMNLFTISKFSGLDPEFVSFTGQYDGYGMASPKMLMLGFKLDL